VVLGVGILSAETGTSFFAEKYGHFDYASSKWRQKAQLQWKIKYRNEWLNERSCGISRWLGFSMEAPPLEL
jgi:hypothetical protein